MNSIYDFQSYIVFSLFCIKGEKNMFRLKDYTSVISKFKPVSHVTILDHRGIDIDYNCIGKYINLYIANIEFIDMLDGEYTCLIKLSSKIGSRNVTRRPIRFSELLDCLANKEVIVVPFNDRTKEIYWDWIDDGSLQDKNVVNIVPVFNKKRTLLQVYIL